MFVFVVIVFRDYVYRIIIIVCAFDHRFSIAIFHLFERLLCWFIFLPFSKRRWKSDRGDTWATAKRDFIVETHAARRRHHVVRLQSRMLLMMMMLLVFHKRGHHHHRLLLMTVAAELADVRWRSGRRWNGRTGFIPAATAIAAAATAAAAHVVAVAIVAKTTVNAAVSTGTTFRFLHKATPFSSGILEPNLNFQLGIPLETMST